MCIITSLSVEKHICKTDKYLQHEPENENLKHLNFSINVFTI